MNQFKKLFKKLFKKRESIVKLDTSDIIQSCEKTLAHSGYYKLKQDRNLILGIMYGKAIISPLAYAVLNETLQRIDAKLAKFSDGEKAIYDTVLGDVSE